METPMKLSLTCLAGFASIGVLSAFHVVDGLSWVLVAFALLIAGFWFAQS